MYSKYYSEVKWCPILTIFLSTKAENNVFYSSYFQIIFWNHVFQILKYYKKILSIWTKLIMNSCFLLSLYILYILSLCNYLGNIEKKKNHFCFYWFGIGIYKNTRLEKIKILESKVEVNLSQDGCVTCGHYYW